MLIVLEGCDGSGKTTLAEALAAKLDGSVISHHGPYTGVDGRALAGTYAAALKPALDGRTVILDRSWLSEPIYARHYRGVESRISKAHQRMLERLAIKAGGVVINCVRPFEAVLESYMRRKGAEYLDNTGQLSNVWKAYFELPSSTFLPTITHDYVQQTTADVVHRLSVLQADYASTRAKRILLVGEKANVRTHAQAAYSIPFVSFSGHGCSEWLAEKLDEAGINESRLRWYNAFMPDGQPAPLEQLCHHGCPVIALGRAASKRLSEVKISHRVVTHPQAHKRFHSGEPYQLIREIQRALSD